jgi:hypothetical protein
LQVLILCHPLVQCFHCPLFSFYGSGSYRKVCPCPGMLACCVGSNRA